MSLVLADPFLDLRGIALDPTEDRAWIDADTALRHHFGQITIADPALAVPAHAQQDDLNRKAAALEQRQQDGSSKNRTLIIRPELMQRSLPLRVDNTDGCLLQRYIQSDILLHEDTLRWLPLWA